MTSPMQVSGARRCLLLAALVGWLVVSLPCPLRAHDPVVVTGIRAEHRHGQTFVTWKDAAEGQAGARFRYTLYRSSRPITEDTLAQARVAATGILHNSAKLFGSDFSPRDRLDPGKPTAILEEGGTPLPLWSGVAVHTTREEGAAYYAVAATDEKLARLSGVVPGESATVTAVDERVAPIQPIKLRSQRRASSGAAAAGGEPPGLPLVLRLHASEGEGGGANPNGDYYLYFATTEMGWRDGLPGVFSVLTRKGQAGTWLELFTRDAIHHPTGRRAMETVWFGYLSVPAGARPSEARAYPFTERRLLWLLEWVAARYQIDRNRVYLTGQSMGGWGSMTFGLRQPDLFAAIHAVLPRMRQRALPAIVPRPRPPQRALMDDGRTDYLERMDMVRFVEQHPGDLPFLAWTIGRRDGFATWKEQVDMARALAAGRHGFVFAWNAKGHSEGEEPMVLVRRDFPRQRFSRAESYPAFSRSSIDNDPGRGDPVEGDPEGGINLGFAWTMVADDASRWAVRVSNQLAQAPMTVDITPRRVQSFRIAPHERIRWATSDGRAGEVVADAHGLATVERVVIQPGAETEISLQRR